MKKNILITGGAGFIGSNFARFIYENYPDYRVMILDALTYAGSVMNFPDQGFRNDRFKFWYGNVQNAELVDNLVSESDVVVHFAAETHVTRSIYDNLLFFQTDVLGTQAVANAVLKYKKRINRFIHISTSEVYGTAVSRSMAEDHPLNPMSPYAAAKAGADRLIYSYWQTYGIPAVIIRPFNNFGPYQHLEKMIPRFITSCILNDDLHVHGDGKSSRDWTFVEDTVLALDKVVHCPIQKITGEVINLGSGVSMDISTIAKMIVKKMKKSEKLIKTIGNRPGQVLRHTASIEKARKLLGWKPRTNFEQGLDRTIRWYWDNRSWWDKQIWLRSIPIVTQEGKTEFH